jgi:hypothetical protein
MSLCHYTAHLDSQYLIQSYGSQNVTCLKQRTHVWELDDSHIIKFLLKDEAEAYVTNAKLARGFGFKTVDTYAMSIARGVYELYAQGEYEDSAISEDPAVLVMSHAKEQSLEQHRKKLDKNDREQLYLTISPQLFVGGLVGMMPDLNDTNIFITKNNEMTLIDFGEGLATLDRIDVRTQLDDFLGSPSRFPHFQVEMDVEDLLTMADKMTDNFYTMAHRQSDLASYVPIVKKRHKDVVKILNSI